MELDRIYSLNGRLMSRLLMNSVKVEGNQISVFRLLRAVRGAERLDTTHLRAR
jgi:hypothetical protein